MWLPTSVVLLSSALAIVSSTPLAIYDGCNAQLFDLDVNAGIGAYTDPSCVGTKESDCFSQTCRLCRFSENEQTKFYRPCPDSLSQSPPDELENAGATACRASPGDQQVGIDKFYDSNCARGGVGCVAESMCRFCHTRKTPQSAHFVPCPSVTEPPPPPETDPNVNCDDAVRSANLPNIGYVKEAKCQQDPRLVGCVRNTPCQLCRNSKNEANQFLISCRVLRDQQSSMKVELKAAAPENESSASFRSEEPSAGHTAASIGACVGAVCAVALVGVSVRKYKKLQHHDNREGSLVRVDRSESIARL